MTLRSLLFAASALAVLAAGPVLGAGEIVAAAEAGDRAAALSLIEAGEDVNARAADGTTALIWAVHRGDLELVQKLIAAGADVAAANDFGATAMTEAAVLGDVGILTALLDAGADPNSPNADGQTALLVIAGTDNLAAAELLIDRGADVNAVESWRGQTPLMWAVIEGRVDMVRLLVEHGADVEARSTVNEWPRQTTSESRAQYRPAGGLTPLLFAARQGCIACAEILLDAGADVNNPDPDQVSPMLMATESFHFDLAKLLLERGADPNKWDRWGRAPLYSAVDMNTLAPGGRPDRPSLDETQPLELARLLLAAGANPNLQLKLRAPYRNVNADRGSDLILDTGATPLFRAAKGGDVEAVRLLLEHGAIVDLPNLSGITPLAAAAGLGSLDIDLRGIHKTQAQAIETIGLLLEAGADINARLWDPRRHSKLEPALEPKQGQTALFAAAFWGWNDVVTYLVDNGADLYAVDANGKTVIDAAMGRAGGNGRNGASIIERPETAALLERLMEERPQQSASAAGE